MANPQWEVVVSVEGQRQLQLLIASSTAAGAVTKGLKKASGILGIAIYAATVTFKPAPDGVIERTEEPAPA